MTSWTTNDPSAYTDLDQAPIWCSFMGVQCGTDSSSADYRRVYSISLHNRRLEGCLTPISKLTSMRHFSVSGNKIVGSIPQSFLNMRRMKHLYLNNNQLTGSIPLGLNLKQDFFDGLHTLSLDSNRLEGNIPERLNIFYGRFLNLSGNSLVGTIPSTFGNMPWIVTLSLDSNSLTGTIPSTLRRLMNLEELDLGNNLLSGTIPVLDQISLQDIDLSANHITMGSLKAVPLSTFSASALAMDIDLRSNCLVFRNPSKPIQDASATHCGGKRILPHSYC